MKGNRMEDNYRRTPRNYTLLTDAYEYTMSDAYIRKGIENDTAVFDLFFRQVPNGGGYVVMAGLDKVIDFINDLQFGEEELEYYRANGYSEVFINYLKNFRFTGDIYAIPDGTPVFPNEPLITVKAPIIQAQILETALLAIVNGATEHATAARRIIEACPKGVSVMEFGARRADGCEAAIDASLYAVMAGCSGTSNVLAAKMVGSKALGTMAHSFVEAFDSEFDAFMNFAECYPDNCILLVDTYDTLRSGVVNAIKTFDAMKEKGIPTDHIGIRIDSGDLAYLSKKAREMLDEAGYPNAAICLSNGLNAETIESLTIQGAKFNSLGVGDNISKPAGRMGAVYKAVAIIHDGKQTPKMKLSNDIIKIVNPGFKKLYRCYDRKTGYALADVMCLCEEKISRDELSIVSLQDFIKSSVITDFDLVPLQKTVFSGGELVYEDPSFEEKKVFCEKQMQTLYPEVRRTLNPHEYYVDGTKDYAEFKNSMIREIKRKVKETCRK